MKRWTRFALIVILATILYPITGLSTPAVAAETTQRNLIPAEIGPERIVLTDGLYVHMFQTAKGTLVAEAGLSLPPGYKLPDKNVNPFIPCWIVSRNKGKDWQRWTPKGVVSGSLYEPPAPGPHYWGAATELSDGTVIILEWIAVKEPDGTWTGQLWESKDDCRTMQGPTPMTVHLPQAKIGHDDSGRPTTGIFIHRSLLQLPGGDLIAPIYCMFKEDTTPIAYQPTMMKMRCVLLRSADRGRSWRYVSTIAVDPTVGQEGFDEPVLIRLSKGPKAGRLVCLMRTGRATHLYGANSGDDGATWSVPRSLGFYGVDPELVEMSDGTLVCGFVWLNKGDNRNKKVPFHLAVSRDQGESWGDLIRMPEGENPIALQWSSYAAMREIDPGRLLVLYDVMPAGMKGTVKYIASREIRVSP